MASHLLDMYTKEDWCQRMRLLALAKCKRVPTTLRVSEAMRAPEYVPSHTRACQVIPHSDRIQQYSSTRSDLLLHQPRNTLTDLGASTRFLPKCCKSVNGAIKSKVDWHDIGLVILGTGQPSQRRFPQGAGTFINGHLVNEHSN